MFIVAFVAGMASQVGFKEIGEHSLEFTEGWGQILNYFVFFFLGLMASRAWNLFNLDLVIYAVLSLTLVRMLPVAVALYRHPAQEEHGALHGVVRPTRACFNCPRPGIYRAGGTSSR